MLDFLHGGILLYDGNGFGSGKEYQRFQTEYHKMTQIGNGFGDPKAYELYSYNHVYPSFYPLTDTDLLIRLAAKQLVKPTGD